MKNMILLLITVLFYSVGISQGIERAVEGMEKQNPAIMSLDKWLSAEKVKAETGLVPSDPEINFNYLFGNNELGGNQYEFELNQSFKLPNYYKTKEAINSLGYQSHEALAAMEKREILKLFRSVYLNIVLLKEKEDYFELQYQNANDLLASVQEGMEQGYYSKPDYDKARLHSLNVNNDLQEIKLQIKLNSTWLKQLNGGIALEEIVYEYPLDWQLFSLDTLQQILLENNPELRFAKLNEQQSALEIKQQRIDNLPSFELGYKSERIFDQALRGIHAGISIPLYENAKKVKYSKLRNEWLQAEYGQKSFQLNSELEMLHKEAVELQRNYQRLEPFLAEKSVQTNAMDLLEANQITIQEYLIDLNLMRELTLNYYFLKNKYYLKLAEIKSLVGY